MRALVVGLGSMGKRRVRNLKALGVSAIGGFDSRADRNAEAANRYGIPVFTGIEIALEAFRPDVLVISTSPRHHLFYARIGLTNRLPCFIEASVVDAAGILSLHRDASEAGVLMAPSCTMRYFAGPRKVKELLGNGLIGRPLTWTYQAGQYLPDWHPWESVGDFYVSERDTGGCREIVPFELTWLADVFGQARALACVKAKLSDLPADIDDVYHCLLEYPGGILGNLVVEVLSRPHATRELRVLGTEGELVFSADENSVRYARAPSREWNRFTLGAGTVESAYINPEEPYIAELGDFLEAVATGDSSRFPNSLEADWRVLQLLGALESLAEREP